MARQEYILCDICEKDITKQDYRLSSEEADVCLKHLFTHKDVFQALNKLGMAEEVDVHTQLNNPHRDPIRVRLDKVITGSSSDARGVTKEELMRQPVRTNEELVKPWSHITKMSFYNALVGKPSTFYLGGNEIPDLVPGDVWLDEAVMVELASAILGKYNVK